MIDVHEAARLAEKQKSNSTATAVIDYDDDLFVVEVVDNGSLSGETDYNCPYVAVSKTTGNVVGFTPMEDLEKFFEAVDNRITYLNED